MFGIYDKKDDCWLGNNEGPKLFDTELKARLAARILAGQLGWSPTRLVAEEFEEEDLQYKDDVQTERSAEEWLEGLERGRYL